MLMGLFRLFRAFSQPAALPLPSQLFGYLPNPALEQLRRKARPLVEEQVEIKKPIESKPPGEIANPVPTVLADSTLRPGEASADLLGFSSALTSKAAAARMDRLVRL